jgi:hypothetical protein
VARLTKREYIFNAPQRQQLPPDIAFALARILR